MKKHPIEDWIDWILPKASDATDPVIRSALQATFEDFCRISGIITEIFPGSIAISAASNTYEIPVLDGLQVAELKKAWYMTVGSVSATPAELIPKGKEELDRIFQNIETDTVEAPSHYFQPSLAEVRVVPNLAAGFSGTLTGRCNWAPSKEAEQVPIVLWEQFRDDITEGVLGRIFQETHKPWSNLELAQAKMKSFWEGVGTARKAVLQGNVRKPQRAQIRSNFR